jgi:transcription elongation factor B subunit 1
MSDKKVTEYVTLVSCDGFEFIVRRSAAIIAKTLNRMLDSTSEFDY